MTTYADADGSPLHQQRAGPVQLVTIDLDQADYQSFYVGYSNSVLWPVFHHRLDLADFDPGFVEGNRRVNQLVARKLLPLLATLRATDVHWWCDTFLQRLRQSHAQESGTPWLRL